MKIDLAKVATPDEMERRKAVSRARLIRLGLLAGPPPAGILAVPGLREGDDK